MSATLQNKHDFLDLVEAISGYNGKALFFYQICLLIPIIDGRQVKPYLLIEIELIESLRLLTFLLQFFYLFFFLCQ